MPRLSIIIPAYNEEKYLPATLAAINAAVVPDAEIILVDNESTDSTRKIAENYGTKIVDESVHNIAQVRNTGARAASGEVLAFLDADTIVQPGMFRAILDVMEDPKCVGGAVEVIYDPIKGRPFVRFFMKLWPILGRFTRMRGGALQYCRAEIFRELGGYDTTIWVGEDIEFHWRLDKRGPTRLIESPKVITSSRRWQNMGLIRMIFFTHPVTIFMFWRFRSFWKDWYERIIR